MSGGLKALAMEEPDVAKMLAAGTHLGTTNVNYQMEQYAWKRRNDGVHIINLKKTYEKLLLAARAIAAIESPTDVYVISSRPMGQRAVLKYARYTGATAIAGRFTPGAFTNQIQAAFREPRLLVVTDPVSDQQSITEASYVNIPVIAFCNTESPLRFVDVAIPCNTKNTTSVGLMWWLLAREVLRLRGSISRAIPWEQEVMPDLFFYRDPEEQEKEEVQKAEVEAASAATAAAVVAAKQESSGIADSSWAGEGVGAPEPVIQSADEWAAPPVAASAAAAAAASVAASAAAAAAPPATAAAPAAPAAAAAPAQDDWNQPTDDWSAVATGTTTEEWGGMAGNDGKW